MPAAFGSQPGPRSLPLAVTQIQVIDSATAPATLDVPIFYLATPTTPARRPATAPAPSSYRTIG